MKISECAQALHAIDLGELADWKGLPVCGPDELGHAFTGGGEPGNGRLSTRPTKFRDYHAPGQPQPLRAWFDGNDRAMLITWIAPSVAGDVRALLDHYGTPEQRLEPGVGYHADAAQWIYASRGITFFVREHEWTLARISVYPPTAIVHYFDTLGAQDRREYLPER